MSRYCYQHPPSVTTDGARGDPKGRFRLLRERDILQSKPSKTLNTTVYIDGLNLQYSLKNTPYTWLNVKGLVENILDLSLHKVSKIKYFTAFSTKRDSAHRQFIYLKVLKTLSDIEIILGKHKKRQIIGKLIEYDHKLKREIITNKTVKIFKPEEKETDVNIASHIIYDCCKGHTDCVVLLSNDTDLKTPLEIVKYKLKKKVIIIPPTKRLEKPGDPIYPNKPHIELRKLSKVNLSIEEHHLKSSQFPNLVNGIYKPKGWS